MPHPGGYNGSLLIVGVIILMGSIFMYIITGKPRLRFILMVNISLIFWMISFIMGILTTGPEMSGLWHIISLMGMTFVLFSFLAAFVDYVKNGSNY